VGTSRTGDRYALVAGSVVKQFGKQVLGFAKHRSGLRSQPDDHHGGGDSSKPASTIIGADVVSYSASQGRTRRLQELPRWIGTLP
jgi:hypothetical protein